MDVETAEGWPTSAAFQPVNAAIIQGALAAIKAAGDIGGIYCTWYQWGEITGSYVPPGQTPLWVAGALSSERRLLQCPVVLPTGPVAGRPFHAQVGADRLRRRRALARAVRVHARPSARR